MAKRTKETAVFLIVDKQAERESLASELRAAGYVVHEYMTAREFLIDKRNQSGGVVLTAFRLRGLSGAELAAQLGDEQAAYPVVAMAKRNDSADAIRSTVWDVILKPASMEKIQIAIQRASRGEESTEEELQKSFDRMTDGERELLPLLATGKTAGDAATDLGISRKTVEAHAARLAAKAQADGICDLIRMWRAARQTSTSERSKKCDDEPRRLSEAWTMEDLSRLPSAARQQQTLPAGR